MRAFRIATIVFGVTLSSALLAAWLVPPMLDWNQYRDTMAALVSDQLGRAVRIDGPVSLSLLPQPILTAGTITVADADDGVSIAVKQLRLRLALGPLLRGQVDAQELVMRGLDLRLPWPLDAQRLQVRAPVWLSSLQARIEGGQVSIGGVAVTRIDATLATLPDTGSYAAAGTASFSGEQWHMTARLTRADGKGAAGLDLTMDGQGRVQGLGGMFSGQLSADGDISGRVSGRGPDLSRLMPAPAVAFRADGRLSVAAGLALADQLSVDIAGSPARGTVALRLGAAPRLDVSLAASRLDLDSWLGAMLAHGDRAAAPFATGIDLSAEAASLAGGVLRALRGRFDINGATIALQDGEAVLPGDARLTLSGAFTAQARSPASKTAPGKEPSLRFDGRGTLDAPTLRTTLAWLDGAGLGLLGALPQTVLHQASLRGAVSAELGTAAQVTLSDLDGTLDGSAVKGGLMARPGARPFVLGHLDLGALELDPWWPAEWPGLAAASGRFSRLDLDLRITAERLRLRGQDVSAAVLDVATTPGRVALRRLEANTASLHLAMAGTMQDGGRITDGRVELRSPGLDQALADLSHFGPLPGALPQVLNAAAPHWPVAVTVQAAGPPEAVALRAVVDAGDLHAEAQPVIDLAGARFAGPLTLRHPGAPRLLEALGFTGTQSWLGDGSLSLVTTLSGSDSRVAADSFDLAAGFLRAGGALVLERGLADSGGEARLSGRIHAETLPLPLPFPRAPDPLPLKPLSGWQASVKLEAAKVLAGLSPVLDQVSTQVTLRDGTLRLEALSGKVDGGSVTGAMTLDSAANPPRLSADLALAGATLAAPLFDLPLDVSAGQMDATVNVRASGFAPQALLATLSGTAHLSVRGGVLVGVDLTRAGAKLTEPDVRAALSGGSTAFDQLDLAATLANGAITFGDGGFVASSGSGRLSGLVDMTGQTSELRLAMRPAVADPPEIAVRVSGPWARPVRTPETAEALVWRATHP